MDQTARGWLANPARRERRDNPNTLTDDQVMKLLAAIDAMPDYSKEDAADMLIRMRDKALIATFQTFFKRGKEILTLKLGSVQMDDQRLSVTFRVQKKMKRYKVCSEPTCQAKNAITAIHCKHCDRVLPEGLVQIKGEDNIFTLTKTLKFPFCPYIVGWLKVCQTVGAQPHHYLFPRYNTMAHNFLWNYCMTVDRFNQILQRLDPTLSSHFFRYGNIEKLRRLGYSEAEIAEISHQDLKTVKTYLKRKGLTEAETRFSEDVR